MSSQDGPRISPWWALLLLPLGLGVGVLVGGLPTPAGPASHAATSSMAPAGEPAALSEWSSIEDAMAESRRTGKPVFIDFSAEWCGPCQQLKREVFGDGRRWDALRAAVIPVSIVDRQREEGRNPPEIADLQHRFGVDAFPTLVVLSAKTNRVERTQGFGGGDRTLDWILGAARSVH